MSKDVISVEQRMKLLQTKKPKIKATGLTKYRIRGQLTKKRQGSYENMYWLLDSSGSMAGEKIHQLIETVEYLLPKYPLVNLVQFDSVVQRIAEDRIPYLYARGSTHMLEALRLAWSCGAVEIVLVTDGDPMDAPKQKILDEASRRNTIPIHTIGIGEDYEREFLQELSRITGAKNVECEEEELHLLSDKFGEVLQITDSNGQGESGGGTIKL